MNITEERNLGKDSTKKAESSPERKYEDLHKFASWKIQLKQFLDINTLSN